MPMAVKLAAALHALGFGDSLGQVEWHHSPPLALRPFDPVTGKHDPDANDPRYIVPLSKADHAVQTNGTAVPLSGDKSKIAKTKRVTDAQAAFRARLLAKEPGREKPKSKWPSRKMRSRK